MRRGFTLAEAIITLGLMGLCLGLLGLLIRDTTRLVTKVGQREQVLYAAGQALDVIARDLRAAVQVALPSGSTLSSVVELQKVDPWSQARLPVPVPSPPPASWSPHAPGVMQTVRYELVGDSLQRTTTPGDVVEIVRGVGGLACKLYGPDTAVISTSVSHDGQVYTLSTELQLHQAPQAVP